MSKVGSAPATRKWWAAAGLLIVVIVGSIGYVLWARRQSELALAPPEPADLSRSYGDPEKVEEVPSFREAMAYIHLCRRRKLTAAEIDRVITLVSKSDHPATVVTALGALVSIDLGEYKPKAVAASVGATKSPSVVVRATALSSLGNFGAKDRAAVVLPFLNSRHEQERSAARLALEKLGYKVPKPAPKD